MAPHDSIFFTPTADVDWLVPSGDWFLRLERADFFSLPEKIHLVRLVIQRQWICDIKNEPGVRGALLDLGLHVACVQDGYCIVTGSGTFGQYLTFRSGSLSLLETGIFYGYSPSAVLAFTGVVAAEENQRWPKTTAQYFLGGVYSAEFSDQERQNLDDQWREIVRVAPGLAISAESMFVDQGEPPAV